MTRVPTESIASESDTSLPDNRSASKRQVGYLPRSEATSETYAGLGFKSGLEIHQQLLTERKLFCHCPAGIYQHGDYDAEVVRHMRPTLSEMGEYDGTALMEKKTRKTIVYRIKDETACTYDIDDTPPFKIDRSALDIALEIAIMLQCNIVGELHLTRKQYLDGSIPTGFQRTGIIGIEGEIPLVNKKIRIIQLSLEEDSCREVSDIGHTRVYTTDRLGMPLIETVTYPEMATPDEVAEAAQYLRLLVRSSGKVRSGIGAARQDVNVSIEGGTRVEIKGVSHIKWIPELTHNEAFRQRALLLIRQELKSRELEPSNWRISSRGCDSNVFGGLPEGISAHLKPNDQVIAVNLPGFGRILSFFTQPGRCFADEISDRLKVIACLTTPNMVHSESRSWLQDADATNIRNMLGAADADAQLLFWGPPDDIGTALETIEERCLLAFDGVPDETRKALSDGTTVFERVLPGPDRMYPDTDSAPIPIDSKQIEKLRNQLADVLPQGLLKLREWEVPADAHHYLLRRDLVPWIERIAGQTGWPEKFVALLFAHTLKGIERKWDSDETIGPDRITDLCVQLSDAGYDRRMAKEALPLLGTNPSRSVSSIIEDFSRRDLPVSAALGMVSELVSRFEEIGVSRPRPSPFKWIMGQLREKVSPNVDLTKLASGIRKELSNG